MPWTVDLATSAESALGRLGSVVRRRLRRRIEQLSDDPRPSGSRKLGGVPLHRIRVGEYRVIYAIYDDTQSVIVVAVGHRSSVYRRLRRR
ncbi:MAG: type II toxin-antitoxin system RelE/ParE family toxin [Chloroflexi bacterium]|nr:type II toxin-antitoxin system RelE/ParE family toxin [Chloroflexota bacterium]